jgi:hypothetical protein
LLHPPNTSSALLSAASHTLNFYQLLADELIKLTNYSPDASKAQPISGMHLSIGLPGTLS